MTNVWSDDLGAVLEEEPPQVLPRAIMERAELVRLLPAQPATEALLDRDYR